MRLSWRVLVSHNLIVPSLEPDASIRPSGEMAADQASPRCPRSRTNAFRVSQSHTTSVRSRLDVAMVRPSRA